MVNITMWGRALRIIPHVTKEEWDRLDLISRWLIATRAAVFLMTGVSCAVGAMIALRDGTFSFWRFSLCLIGLIFAHATNNLVNDLTDSMQGVDKDNYFRTQYGPQPYEQGLLSFKQMIQYIAVTGGIALTCGLILVFDNPAVLWPLLLGVFFVLFYTWPLKHIGLGEPAVLIVWGPLMIGGTYLVSSGYWNPDITLISIVYAIGPTTVLFGKHTDKLEADKQKGIHTLPVILGEHFSRLTVIALLLLQPLLVLFLIAIGRLGLSMLVVLLGIPSIFRAIQIFRKPRPTERPDWFPEEAWPAYLAACAFVTNRTTGVLFLLGLLLDIAFYRMFF